MALRELSARVRLLLDRASARRLEVEIQRALKRGTDPSGVKSNTGAIEGAFDRLINKAKSLAAYFAVAFAARAVKRFVESSVEEFSKFDSAITQSLAIAQNVTAKQRKAMEDTARAISVALNISADKVAEGFYFLISAGLDVEQAIKALPAVAQFAKAGMFDLATATDLLVSSQSALNLTSKDATQNLTNMKRVSDVLVAANIISQGSVESFAESLNNKAAAAMRNFGIEVEEGVAILAVYAQQGVQGQRAGERFTILLQRLTDAFIRNRGSFKQFGIELEDAATHRMRPVADIIGDISKSLEGLSPVQRAARLQMLGFTVEAQEAILPLLGYSDRIRDAEKSIRSMGGVTKDVADKQMAAFQERMGQINQVWSEFKRQLGSAVGEGFAQAAMGAGDLTGTLQILLDFVAQNRETLGGLVYILTTLTLWVGKATVAIVGGFISGMRSLGNIVNGVLSAVVAVTGAFQAFTVPINWLFNKMRDAASFAGLDRLARWFGSVASAAERATKVIRSFSGEALRASGQQFRTAARGEGQAPSVEDLLAGRALELPAAGARRDSRGRLIPVAAPGIEAGRGGTGAGVETEPDIAAKELVRKRNAVIKSIGDALADLTQSQLDDAMRKIDALDAEARQVFGTNIPAHVTVGIARLRAAALKQEKFDVSSARVDKLQDQLRLGGPAAIEALGQMPEVIKSIEAERAATAEGSAVREKYNKLLAETNKLFADLRKQVKDDVEKQLTERLSLQQKQLQRIRDTAAQGPISAAGQLKPADELIDSLRAERDALEVGSKEWEMYDDVLRDAIKTRLELSDAIVKSAEDIEKERHERLMKEWESLTDAAQTTAAGIAGSFADAFQLIFEGASATGTALTKLGRGIAGTFLGAIAQWAAKKATENFIQAAEDIAYAWSSMGNPLTAGLAPIYFHAAAQHAAVGTAWAAFAGVAAGGQSAVAGGGRGGQAGGVPSGATDPAGRLLDQNGRNQSEFHIYVDGVDPKNPRHQELIGEAQRQFQETTGGKIIYHGTAA